jgi:hypothetical protein
MKKYLALIGAGILVVALVSPAMAQQDWTKGFKTTSLFQIWSNWIKNQTFDDNVDKTLKGVSSRVNFFLEWGDAKYVRAVVGFEMDSTNWGESTWAPGESTTNQNPINRYGVRNADQNQLEIKHAYLDFAIPSTPLRLSLGVQGFYIGGRLFQSIDVPGAIVTADFSPHKIMGYWWRENDGLGTNVTDREKYNVNDTYALQYQFSEKIFNVYAYGAYKNDLRSASYSDNPYWIGVGGGVRPDKFDLSGQLVYLGGTRDYTTANDVDYTAWAAEILGKYTIAPGLLVGLEGYYSTGNDPDDASKIKLYQVPAGSETYSNFGLDRSVFFFMNFGQLGGQHSKISTGYLGYWYGRANLDYSPLAWLRLNFNYLYIGDTSSGTANGTSLVNTSNTGVQQWTDESFVGHEINVIASVKIYQNFTYRFGLGYFLPGGVYDQYSSAGVKTKDADNAWAFNTGCQLAF